MYNLTKAKKELIGYLDSIATEAGWPLSNRCRELLFKYIKYVSLKRGEYLLTPGNVCENLYFIEKGMLKCFFAKGKKSIVDWFFGKGQTVVSVDSFYDQVPGKDWIEALHDCDLLYITYAELEHLYRTCLEFNVVGRIFTNRYLRIWHRQARNCRMRKAKERYLYMLETQPELVQLVPQIDLSSFLDMTPETLTRIRSKLKREKK